jgi:hypothetical protein
MSQDLTIHIFKSQTQVLTIQLNLFVFTIGITNELFDNELDHNLNVTSIN